MAGSLMGMKRRQRAIWHIKGWSLEMCPQKEESVIIIMNKILGNLALYDGERLKRGR